jgi:hypothetical protein
MSVDLVDALRVRKVGHAESVCADTTCPQGVISTHRADFLLEKETKAITHFLLVPAYIRRLQG